MGSIIFKPGCNVVIRHHVIVDSGVSIGDATTIGRRTGVGAGASIGSNVPLGRNIVVEPGANILDGEIVPNETTMTGSP